MRNLILKRLEEFREDSRDGPDRVAFSKHTYRWNKNFTITLPTGHAVHVSEVDFEKLDDETLLTAFERIVTRRGKQM